ncbi:MAG: c-type cytochrome [Telluria sp.]
MFLALLVAFVIVPWSNPTQAKAPRAAAVDVVTRGRYLANVAGCVGCHTAPGGEMLAGGSQLRTAFGTFYAPNLTPDPGGGIGRWSADEFYRAVHEGRRRDGSPMYPAMPYAAFTRLTRADTDAILAFLRSVPPAARAARAPDLAWPYRDPAVLTAWRNAYFQEGEFETDDTRTGAWNRGAYLVQGAGQCLLCHVAGPGDGAAAVRGLERGLAPMLDWSRTGPGGAASVDAVVLQLRLGADKHRTAIAPVTGAIPATLRELSDEDLRAVAVYLLSQRPDARAAASPRT